MKEKITDLVNKIENPTTGATLVSENRIIDVEFGEGEKTVKIKFNREGIDPENKRKIEDAIYEALEGTMDEDSVEVYSFSKNSKDVFHGDPPKEKKPAQIQAGHSHMEPKKRVPGIKNVLAVASGKGGVGKSTFSVNLALSLTKQGKKVGILDSDVYGPSIPLLMGQREAKPVASDNKKIIPIEAHGVKFISFGLFVDEKEAVIWRGPMLGGVLKQFLFDVDWGGLDYLIIDLPPGTGDMQLSMVQTVEVDGAVVISTPQDVALLDAKKGLQMFNKVNVPVIGMVENMSSFICDSCDKEHFIFGKGGVEKAVVEVGTEYLGGIPLEIAIQEGSDSGKPYMNEPSNEGKKAWSAYNLVAANINKKFDKEDAPGFFKNLFRK